MPEPANETSDYTTSTLTLEAAAKWLLEAEGPVLVVTHAKPDGDALGSATAAAGALRARGVEAVTVLCPPVPQNLLDLPPIQEQLERDELVIFDPAHADEASRIADLPRFDRLLIVDTGAYSQLGPLANLVRERVADTLILDHHLSGDVPAPRRYVDGRAAAAAEIVAALIDAMPPPATHADAEERGSASDRASGMGLTPAIAEALYVGIASDTGWFRFANTRPATLRLAARLIEAGVDHAALHRRLEQTDRAEKIALLGRALASLRLLNGGKAAVITLTRDDFAQTGATEDETERLIDTPQQIASVEVICLLTEREVPGHEAAGHHTRLSLRSKPPLDPRAEPVNVAEIARRFGGGGHAQAAGARVDRPLAEVEAEVIRLLQNL